MGLERKPPLVLAMDLEKNVWVFIHGFRERERERERDSWVFGQDLERERRLGFLPWVYKERELGFLAKI